MLEFEIKNIKYHPNSLLWSSFEGGCFFSAWFLPFVSCPVSPWPRVALCRCPEHKLPSGPLTGTSEHLTAFMVHTSLSSRQHLFSGHLSSPFKTERGTVKKCIHCSESTWLRLPPSVSCNSLRANINWVWTRMKDTANIRLKSRLWCWELEWSHVSVSAEYNTSSRFCNISFQRSVSGPARRQGASVCLQSFKSTFNLADASLGQLLLTSAAANLSV